MMISGFMKKYCLSFLMILPLFASGQVNKVCFTYDDLPVVPYGANDSISQQRLTTKLVGTIVSQQIPATGFVNEIKLFENDSPITYQINLLKVWCQNGLELGNHTYSHHDYNHVSFQSFTDDLVKGEVVTSELLAAQGKKVRYFRHPYLHTGTPQQRADSLEQFLQRRGYTTAPVTIDNDDYLFALAYRRALGRSDTALASQIGRDYVVYMEQKALYFEKQSNRLFGRNISQILLLHANQLNADFTDELAAMFRRNKYTFVSLEEAMQDPAYTTPVKVFGAWGISWLDRWALSAGQKGAFFKDDPPTPEYIRKLTE
jgi:peptidoglycan/xylan/chitin deacetylase (PgdA/CDA1 family)